MIVVWELIRKNKKYINKMISTNYYVKFCISSDILTDDAQ